VVDLSRRNTSEATLPKSLQIVGTISSVLNNGNAVPVDLYIFVEQTKTIIIDLASGKLMDA